MAGGDRVIECPMPNGVSTDLLHGLSQRNIRQLCDFHRRSEHSQDSRPS